MVHKTDVFVVGGGPSGLAAAIAARKKGFTVTVADGSQPPIDKACGEGLLPDTLAALADLGVRVSASEGYLLRGVRFVGSESEAAATFPGSHGIGMRRRVLHEKLIERARAVGALLLWNTPVTGICSDGAKLSEGAVLAKWLVGADGIGSRVRKWAGLEPSLRPDCRYAVRRHYRVRPWSETTEIHWGDRAQAYVTPVGEHEVCVVVVSREREAGFDRMEAQFPRLARRLESADLADVERGAVTRAERLDRVYDQQVALVGDASGTVDAITGEGLSLGFRQAIALANALAGNDLARYQAAHRRLTRRPALMGRLMLALDGRPWLRERILHAFASENRIFPRLLAVHVGAKPQAHLAAIGISLGWHLVAA